MTALTLAGPLTEAEALSLAADLIDRWGLCVTNYEGDDESLDPSGAIAVALDLPAGVWQSPHWTVLQHNASYELAYRALYILVDSLDRWDMARPAEEPWDGESLADHIAFWLEDVRPSAEVVVQQMRDAAKSLAEQVEVSA